MDGWIIVRNWDKFQHYKDRHPIWIKLYTNLNSSDDWLGLTMAERGLLVTIWMEYARSKKRLSVDLITRLSVAPRHVQRHLTSLSDAGFIEVRASYRSREEKKGVALATGEESKAKADVDREMLELAKSWSARQMAAP
jgi:DNA-binding MarR family transcriptional regulator